MNTPHHQMEAAVNFAKALSMLVQDIRGQQDPDALRLLLIQAREHSRSRGLRLELRDGFLLLDGCHATQPSGGLEVLYEAMHAHDVGRITIAESASPRELLQLAVLLSHPPKGQDEATIIDEARELALWSVRIHPADHGQHNTVAAGAHDLGALSREHACKRAREMAAQIADAARSENVLRAVSLMRLLMDVERVADASTRECWTDAFNEVLEGPALRMAAFSVPEAGDDRPALIALLKRAGVAGASTAISLLMSSDTICRRRAFYDTVLELQAGIPLLIDLLRHPQWYVVRNAALLLGEMRASEADSELAALLAHKDERVRIAASSALSQLSTPDARAALQEALGDPSAEVRRRALRGFVNETGRVASGALVRALDVEDDPEVQIDILYTMGRVRTPDAVQKLIRVCAPSGQQQSTGTFRIAAAEALMTARGPAALPVLRALLDDEDPDIRSSARALINSLSRAAAQ